MAKVYVSSTIADLEAERRAVMDWLVTAGHQPVHSYRPDSETVRESCLEDVDACNLYVLISGHRYGFQPEHDNPEKLSITQLEFRRAGTSGIPRIALLRMCVPDVTLSDLSDSARAELVWGFHREVRAAVRPFEFRHDAGLITGLSSGVQAALEKEAARDNPRVLRIMATLTDDLERKDSRIRELEEQLQAAVARTVLAAEKPNASAVAIAAAAALDVGNTRPAEALLSREEDKEAAQIALSGVDDAEQRKRAAALAREQGAFAMGRDVRAALAAFERAGEYEPEDLWPHNFIGDMQVLTGDLSSALRSFRRAYELAEALVARDPGNTEWQRDLSVSHNRIGDVLAAQGDGPGALAAYRKGLGIAEALGARDPANTGWQRDLSVSHNKIGEIFAAQGDGPGALAAYRKGLGIREALAARGPANTEWQRDLSVSHERIGGVLAAQGDRPGALAAYRKGLWIREALAARDPENTEWQRDLSVSHSKVGDMLARQGDGPGALAAYCIGLGICDALAARDPANTEWHRDLSVGYEKIGTVLAAQGDGSGALAAYRKGLEIRELLAARDPENALWQTDLAASCFKLGILEHGQTLDVRRDFLKRGRKILAQLKARERLHPEQDWIQLFDEQLGLIGDSSLR